MKQKTTKPLTKKDLENVFDKKLKNYPTKSDVQDILDKKLKNYPTNDDLNDRFSKLIKAFRQEEEFAHQQLKNEILDGVRIIVDRVMTTIDPLLQELETRRMDREIASDQSLRFRDELDDHEKRIQKLEQS